MYQTINKCDFHDAFKSMGRENQFSYEGLDALYDYLEQYEEDTGEKIELDVIALCCEYTEYDNIAEFHDNYNTDAETLDDIRELTTVIEIPDSERFIIQDF
jgi:hypothetical protein